MKLKPNLLCIVPPYTINCPPSSAACLLGYLKANGCHDFSFIDLRLHTPYVYMASYRPAGVFGETYVLDVPDLPLVLRLLQSYDAGRPLTDGLFDDEFVDYCVMRGIHPQTLSAYLANIDAFLARSFAQIPDLRFVGFSTWTSNYLTTLMAAAHLKRRKNAPFVLAGGPQVTQSVASAKLGLRSGLFDAVALGEGEETLLSVYEEFSKDGRHVDARVPGTMQVDPATRAFVTSERPLLRLKELPLPSFDEMMLGSYRSQTHGREIPHQLSRGCTDKCTFCSEWVFWRKFRLNSMEIVVEQIEELVKRYGAQVIRFTDSLLNGQMGRFREFAEALIRKNVGVSWLGFMRADMDRETALLIKRAGCVEAFLGIESFSTETLELMNKRRTEADNIKAVREFLQAGIRVMAGFIPGFPGDTRERFLHTAQALVALQNEYPGLLETNTDAFVLGPGMPIYKTPEEFGMRLNPWPEGLYARASRYEDIVREVSYTVDGPNQGMERLGQLRIAQTLLDGHNLTERLQIWHSPFVLDFEHIYLDVFLARAQNGAGHTYAALLTRDEKEAYERMSSVERIMAGQEGHLPVMERTAYRNWFQKIESAHAVIDSRERSAVFATRQVSKLEPHFLMRSPPFIVARAFGSDLVVMHRVTGKYVRLPVAAGPWLKTVAHSARTVEELETDARQSGLAVKVDDLRKKGLLEVCGPEAETPAFIARNAAGGVEHGRGGLVGANRLVR